MSILEPKETDEGESYMENKTLDLVTVPSTISGIFTLTHKIDEASPLRDFALDPEEGHGIVVSVTIVALDSVYQQDIQAIKRYSVDRGHFLRNVRFVDCMTMDEKRGLPRVDFAKFDDVDEILAPSPNKDGQAYGYSEVTANAHTGSQNAVGDAPGRVSSSQGSLRIAATTMISTSNDVQTLRIPTNLVPVSSRPSVQIPAHDTVAKDDVRDAPVSADLPTMTAVYEGTVEPEWERNVVYVMHGGYRLAEGLPVVTVCPHTTWLLGIMRHMGLVMTYMAIDLDKKPAWFTRKFKAGSTPSVMYNGEVVEDSSVIFEWLPKTFPEEAKRVFVPEVGLDKPVAAMVMGALMGVMGDTTNDGGKQKEALDAWPTALAPLEGALEKHGMLGVGGKVSAADFRAAAFIYLAELIAPLLPGVLRNLDVLGKYPNISRWMGEGGMRGWMVSVSAAPRMASLACAQSTSLSAKMPGLVVDDEMVADRECFLQEHGLSSHPRKRVLIPFAPNDECSRVPGSCQVQESVDRCVLAVPQWMTDAKLLPDQVLQLHERMQELGVDVSLLPFLDAEGFSELGVVSSIQRTKLCRYFSRSLGQVEQAFNTGGMETGERSSDLRSEQVQRKHPALQSSPVQIQAQAPMQESSIPALAQAPARTKPKLLRKKSTADFCI